MIVPTVLRGLRETVFKDRYANLGEYLTGFAYTCAVMRDAEALERIAYELAQDCQAEGVRYVLRFGRITGAGDLGGAEDQRRGLNRYLFITARVNAAQFPEPQLEPLPAELRDRRAFRRALDAVASPRQPGPGLRS